MSEYEFDEAAEADPFLGGDDSEQGDESPAAGQAVPPPPPEKFRAEWYQAKTPGLIVGLISLMMFFLVLSATLTMMPMVRLFEDTLCRRYYDTTEPVEEKKCKVDDIQNTLAWLGGISAVLNSVIALVVSFPWGILSDRIGRKPIFRLAYGGLILQFLWTFSILALRDVVSIYLVFISPFFSIIGGGVDVAIAVIHSIIADVSTERTKSFIWAGIGAVAGGVIGPAAAAGLMERFSPWIPILVPFTILTPIVFGITIFIPETLPRSSSSSSTTSTESRTSTTPVPPKKPFVQTVRAHLRDSRHRLRESLTMLRSRSVLLLLTVFLATAPMQTAQLQTLAQSVSTRFGWTIAQTGYLFSVRGLLTMAVMAALPSATALLGRRLGLGVFAKDLLLARLSAGFLVLGFVLMGGPSLAATLSGVAVSTLAVGLGSAAKALVAYYVDREHTSRLYTLTSMVETVGGFFAGPSLAWAFSVGNRWDGGWRGLPFFLVAALCALVLVALCFVRRPPGVKDPDAETDEEEAGELLVGVFDEENGPLIG